MHSCFSPLLFVNLSKIGTPFFQEPSLGRERREGGRQKTGQTPLFTFSNTGVRSVGARLQSIVFREVRFIRRGSLIINCQTEPEPVKCYLENSRICMPDEGVEVYFLNG
jgi:hypothetical protein